MLKVYEVDGLTYQFEEGDQPKGAKEVTPQSKQAKPANKSRKAKSK